MRLINPAVAGKDKVKMINGSKAPAMAGIKNGKDTKAIKLKDANIWNPKTGRYVKEQQYRLLKNKGWDLGLLRRNNFIDHPEFNGTMSSSDWLERSSTAPTFVSKKGDRLNELLDKNMSEDKKITNHRFMTEIVTLAKRGLYLRATRMYENKFKCSQADAEAGIQNWLEEVGLEGLADNYISAMAQEYISNMHDDVTDDQWDEVHRENAQDNWEQAIYSGKGIKSLVFEVEGLTDTLGDLTKKLRDLKRSVDDTYDTAFRVYRNYIKIEKGEDRDDLPF